jgi:DNA-directed RNA polymerase specialized sigma24 family protein
MRCKNRTGRPSAGRGPTETAPRRTPCATKEPIRTQSARAIRARPAARALAADEPRAMSGSPRDDGSAAARPPGVELSLAVRRALAENRARFLRFVRRRVGRADVAEEILHDAIVRAIVRGDGVRDQDAIVPWFYRLLRNATVDHLRGESAERRGLSSFARESAGELGGDAGVSLVDTICSCVSGLVAVLKTEYATALNRVDLGGESIGGYARAAGISAGNASVRLHRARRALRRAVDAHCGACAERGGYLCECQAEPHRPPVASGAA